MAEASISVGQDQFSCSICLDLLKVPVTIPCGHSYCMDCIKGCWDQEDQVGVYRCPQCRHTFTPRPVLGRNTMLAEVVEKVKKSGLQAAPPAPFSSGPGDVECDVCIGRKKKAVKSCLVCLASYCRTHLQPHYESAPLRKHKLTDSTGHLQDKICSLHDKVLELYCRTDRQCVCYLCTVDEHRGHNTVSAAAEKNKKQKELWMIQREFQLLMRERERDVQELRQAVDSLARSAQAALEDTESIFSEMIRSIERRRSEVRDLIRAQEKAAIHRAEGLQKQAEQEIAELKRRHSELQKVLHTEDDVHFLKVYQCVCVPPGPGKLPAFTINPHCSFGDVRKPVLELKKQVELSCKKKIEKILQKAEPKRRAEFLLYSCQLSLDPNTAQRELSLSEGNREVRRRGKPQPYPDHPHRFDWPQVLCREGLTGRCYWEVEWSGTSGVYIAVAYKGIGRRGRTCNCGLGGNDKSWSLVCSVSSYSFWHNNERTEVYGPSSSTIGVYLDHSAGALSFYSVSKDTMTLLHRVQTSFTEPLYPGFYVFKGTDAKLCSVP
uniref:Tripartite motif-containing protein 16-like n=1 Tax=Scleropages formosus TaxID=113540 RepID=A0A8C9S9R1_SCLFO